MATSKEPRRALQAMAAAMTVLVLGGVVLFVTTSRSCSPDLPPEVTGVSLPGPAPRREISAPRGRLREQPAPPSEQMDPVRSIAVDASGAPLPGGAKAFESMDSSRSYYYLSVVASDGNGELATVRPEHDGSFTLPKEARNQTIRLYAIDDRSGVVLEHPGDVQPDEIDGRRVRFALPATTTRATIRCIDDAGAGIRAKVKIGPAFHFPLTTVETDAEGHVETTISGTGEFIAQLVSAATRSKAFLTPPERRFAVGGGLPVTVEFVLPRPAEIVASVVDQDGRPLPGVVVFLRVFEGGRFRGHPDAKSTDAEGRARLEGIEPGAIMLQAGVLGRVPVVRRMRVGPGLHRETFTLVPGGYLVSAKFTGLPAGSAGDSVPVHLLRVADVTGEAVAYHLRLAPDGTFEADGVPGGRFQITLMHNDGRQVMVWFSVPNGPVDLGVIDLSDVYRVGESEMRVRVDAEDESRGSGPMVLYRNETWPADTWRPLQNWLGEPTLVKGLTAGFYRLRLSPQGHDPDLWDLSASVTVSLTSGAETPEAVLTIRPR